MVKYATALRIGTVEAEQVLRRFTKGGPKHATYQAFEELGFGKVAACFRRSSLRLPFLAGVVRTQRDGIAGRGQHDLRRREHIDQRWLCQPEQPGPPVRK